MNCRSGWPGRLSRRWGAIGLYLAVVLLALLGWLAGAPRHEEPGLSQNRLDTAGPPLAPGHSVGQSFVGERPGLAWIEIYLVRYNGEVYQDLEGALTLTLRRVDGSGEPVSVAHPTAALSHNQRLRFSFAPQPDSQGAGYQFDLTCDVAAGLSAWYTQSEAYAAGELLLDGEPQPGDLNFALGYRYPPVDLLRAMSREAARWWPATLGLLLAWIVPGWGLLAVLGADAAKDGWEKLGLAAALSATVWAVAFLWARTLGVRLSATTGALVILGCVAASLFPRMRGRAVAAPPAERYLCPWPNVVMAVVVLLTVATRLLHVRNLVVPAWVDSPHHALMTQLMLEQGMVARSASPYLPVADLHYHFGFHASAVPLVWFAGLGVADAVLLAGQLWQIVAPLGIYALVRRLSNDRWSPVIAAGLVSVWLYMPAYYTTWGRYPHLAGLTLLSFSAGHVPALLRQERVSRSSLALVALLSAGLGLAHFRILVLYVLWWLVCLGGVLWEHRRDPHARKRLIERSALAALLVVAMVLPWAIYVARRVLPTVEATYGGWAAQDGDNAFPWRYFTGTHTRVLSGLAAIGLAWGVARRQRAMVWLGLWVAASALVSLPQLIGLAPTWLMSSSALAISFWLPVGVLAGYLVGDCLAVAVEQLRLKTGDRVWPAMARSMMAAILTVLAGWGAWRMADIVNPNTVLVDEGDMAAMAWIRDETPPSSVFLVNARYWVPGIYVGSDAGWWIPYLTGRRVTQPAILYHQGSAHYRESVAEIAEQLAGLENDGEELATWLHSLGVTHVYIGSRGGALTPRLLDDVPAVEPVYASGPVRIYRLRDTS